MVGILARIGRYDFAIVCFAVLAILGGIQLGEQFQQVDDREGPARLLDALLWSTVLIALAALAAASRRGDRMNAAFHHLEEAERRAAWLASHDALTEVPNRRYLEGLLRRTGDGATLATRPGVAVLAVDLDGFKQVNSLVGYAGGDALLREVARRVRETVGREDVIRVGGDEFLVIADRRRVPEPVRLAEAIVATLGSAMDTAHVKAQVGACVGLALIPEDTASLSKAIAYADMALLDSKRAGRGSITEFREELGLTLERRVDLETGLRRAIASGEIVPHYQPLYNLSTGALSGFEALARWMRPSGETVPPSEFVAVAEELGMIVELSDMLLRQACEDARGWYGDLRLSFNVSPVQLGDRMLAERIAWILDGCGFPPERLQVEITEGVLISDEAGASEVIAKLRAMGIRIALDDFGTGYSSLAQLARYRFDAIKIDQRFIAQAALDEGQRVVVRAIVALGHGLDIPLTAEGIEEPEQVEWLRTLGCDVGQGYHLGRPVSAHDAAAIAAGAWTPPVDDAGTAA